MIRCFTLACRVCTYTKTKRAFHTPYLIFHCFKETDGLKMKDSEDR
jgi:hypothetical protein